VDPTVLKPVVERWARLLAECDARTSEDLEREGDELSALFGAEGLARFAKLVTAYDFDGALEALRKAVGERGL
jgi:two-component system sensor histidine kinase/response regulator